MLVKNRQKTEYKREVRPFYIRTFLYLLLILSMTLSLAGCSLKSESTVPEETTSIEEMDPANIDDITMEGITSDIIRDMSLEEKVGQLFIVSTDSLDYDGAQKMTEEMKKRLKKYKPGGILFFGFNIKNRKQITSFIEDLQACSDIPLFICVDEEGGDVARIANAEEMDTTKFPSMKQIGLTGDPDQAKNVGETIGREIHELGFNVDFAPVCDIVTNENNTEIGNRSFGSDPSLVSEMVSAEVKALQEQNVSATLKHFPGQGDSGEDTHRGFVELETTIDRLRSTEFKPFEAGIKAGADFVMVSHVSVKSVTGQEIPASMSRLMITDILRDELQYSGLVITDAMNMKGITKFYDPDTAAVTAIQAGCDLVLMPDDYAIATEGVLEAVDEGTITEEQINMAVTRILATKIRRGVYPLTSDLLRDQ